MKIWNAFVDLLNWAAPYFLIFVVLINAAAYIYPQEAEIMMADLGFQWEIIGIKIDAYDQNLYLNTLDQELLRQCNDEATDFFVSGESTLPPIVGENPSIELVFKEVDGEGYTAVTALRQYIINQNKVYLDYGVNLSILRGGSEGYIETVLKHECVHVAQYHALVKFLKIKGLSRSFEANEISPLRNASIYRMFLFLGDYHLKYLVLTRVEVPAWEVSCKEYKARNLNPPDSLSRKICEVYNHYGSGYKFTQAVINVLGPLQ